MPATSHYLAIQTTGSRKPRLRLVCLPTDRLSAGQIRIAVHFTGLVSDDLRLLSGKQATPEPVVPGTDVLGVVAESASSRWQQGQQVLVLGHGLGRSGRHGGLAEQLVVAEDLAEPVPDGFTPEQAISLGTPGLCAIKAIHALEGLGVTPEVGPVLVTGASGAVGSLCVIALAEAGYEVTASTRRPELEPYLARLGATKVAIGDPTADGSPDHWSAIVDCVGGTGFHRLVGQLRYTGVMAVCGFAAGTTCELDLTDIAHRGIALIGIDALHASPRLRLEAWQLWTDLLDPQKLATAVAVLNAADLALLSDPGRHGRALVRLPLDQLEARQTHVQ